MEPQLISAKEMKVIGIEVQTSNQNEMNFDTAKIPKLWGQFFQERITDRIPNKEPNNISVGVYSKYESGHAGS